MDTGYIARCEPYECSFGDRCQLMDCKYIHSGRVWSDDDLEYWASKESFQCYMNSGPGNRWSCKGKDSQRQELRNNTGKGKSDNTGEKGKVKGKGKKSGQKKGK